MKSHKKESLTGKMTKKADRLIKIIRNTGLAIKKQAALQSL